MSVSMKLMDKLQHIHIEKYHALIKNMYVQT